MMDMEFLNAFNDLVTGGVLLKMKSESRFDLFAAEEEGRGTAKAFNR